MVVYRKDPGDLEPITGNTAAQSIDDTSNEEEKTANNTSLMVPRAILTSRPNSHPFQERHLVLDQPIKIGRSVARCRPGSNNAIFDCKVLSRNHALLWYENGKFYLKDTKSSNGTFVNNQRLSKGSEESIAREVCSGDIVQFGVDVVENARKVVHGCVVATLRLYLPDGKEAKASPTTAVVSLTPDASVSSQELYQLSQYLQEALHREQVLESKLGTLQKVVSNTQDESDIGWKALIEEDRLLSRIETLESQLQTCGKNVTEEKLRGDVLKLQDDKDKYQNAAKESLTKAMQEKMEAMMKVQDLENSLSNAETECSHLREVNKNTEQEMQYLLDKCTENDKEISDISKKLQEAEEKYQDLLNQAADEKIEIESRVDEMKNKEQSLSAKIEALEAENDFSKGQLESLKAHFDMYKKNQQMDTKMEKNGILSPCEDDLESPNEELQKKLDIQELNLEVRRLQLELERIREENEKNENSILLNYTENSTHQTNGDMKSSDYINQLQAEIQQLKKLLSESRENKRSLEAELVQLKGQLDDTQNNVMKVQDELSSTQQQLSQSRQYLKEKTEEIISLESKLYSLESSKITDDAEEKEKDDTESFSNEQNKQQLAVLQEQLLCAKQQLKDSENESAQLKKKIEDLSDEVLKKKEVDNKTISELSTLREECSMCHARIQAMESEMRKYRNKNTQLQADNEDLQKRCEVLEAAKTSLENKSDDYWKEQVATAKTEAQQMENKLSEAQSEIVTIKERFSECNSEKSVVQKEKQNMEEQLRVLKVQSKATHICCIIPVFVLMFAIAIAFFPSLKKFTATSDQT